MNKFTQAAHFLRRLNKAFDYAEWQRDCPPRPGEPNRFEVSKPPRPGEPNWFEVSETILRPDKYALPRYALEGRFLMRRKKHKTYRVLDWHVIVLLYTGTRGPIEVARMKQPLMSVTELRNWARMVAVMDASVRPHEEVDPIRWRKYSIPSTP